MNHDLHPNRLMRIYMWFYMQRANFGNAQHPSLRNENTQEVLWYQNLSTIEFSRNVYSQSINYTLSASIYSQWAIFHVPLSRLKSIGTANAILHCTKHKMLSIAPNLDLLYFGFSMIDNFFLPLWKFFFLISRKWKFSDTLYRNTFVKLHQRRETQSVHIIF